MRCSLSEPSVVIGIVTHNSSADIGACLDAIAEQLGALIHVRIWDNASQDQTVARIKQYYPQISVHCHQTNIGFARAHNALFAECLRLEADYYWALNPDVILDTGCLSALLSLMQARQEIGWATGQLRRDANTIDSRGHAQLNASYVVNIGQGLPRSQPFPTQEVYGACGAAALYRVAMIRDVIAQTGEFYDSSYFLYGEDCDLDWRARRLGWRCWYVAEATLLHRGSEPTERLRVMAVANRLASAVKNSAVRRLPQLMLMIVAHATLRLCLTPRSGWQLLRHIRRLLPIAWHKRYRPRISDREIHDWWRWGRQQATGNPRTLPQRARGLLGRL